MEGCASIRPVLLAGGGGAVLAGTPFTLPWGVTLQLTRIDKYRAMEIEGYPWELTQIKAVDINPEHILFNDDAYLGFIINEYQMSWRFLPVYPAVAEDTKWQSLTQPAVSDNCREAWIPIAETGKYAIFHPALWGTMVCDGDTLVFRRDGIPATVVFSPVVITSGKRTDESVIQAVMAVTGRDRAGAIELLLSYDTTGDNIVQVLESRQNLIISVRYWGPSDKLGRWYGVQETEDTLLLPREAIRWYALPASNNAENTTMYQFRKGAKLIYGVCADMRWNPVFSPDAIGGGKQFYAPDSTVFVIDHVELNPAVCRLLSELRHNISQGV